MKYINQTFWAGFVVGAVLCVGAIGVVLKIQKDDDALFRHSDIPPAKTIRHYEKIGNCHYTFDVDTITNEVKKIKYFVPLGDEESWERKNSATGRDE